MRFLGKVFLGLILISIGYLGCKYGWIYQIIDWIKINVNLE
jgi:hypothetical protein